MSEVVVDQLNKKTGILSITSWSTPGWLQKGGELKILLLRERLKHNFVTATTTHKKTVTRHGQSGDRASKTAGGPQWDKKKSRPPPLRGKTAEVRKSEKNHTPQDGPEKGSAKKEDATPLD